MPKFKFTLSENRKRAAEVYKRLRKAYPDAQCSLDFTKPLELLIATILAAQCTDERVNIVTKDLFKRYPSAEDYVAAPQEELEAAIRSCGFYRNKSKSIKKACHSIVEDFGGAVPGTMDELLGLDGVGRKTANVILGECFETAGIVVDTHCTRLANRLKFTKHKDPVKIEQDLMKIWEKDTWTLYSHSFVFHGRATCVARGPKCSECCIREFCAFPDTREGAKIAK